MAACCSARACWACCWACCCAARPAGRLRLPRGPLAGGGQQGPRPVLLDEDRGRLGAQPGPEGGRAGLQLPDPGALRGRVVDDVALGPDRRGQALPHQARETRARQPEREVVERVAPAGDEDLPYPGVEPGLGRVGRSARSASACRSPPSRAAARSRSAASEVARAVAASRSATAAATGRAGVLGTHRGPGGPAGRQHQQRGPQHGGAQERSVRDGGHRAGSAGPAPVWRSRPA